MTYTQAQSPRLGQRVAPETTYVEIFDVDPDTPTADLVEAAWPGMLIFRKDLSILQIYNGEAGAWQDVAGGVAGQLTYVGVSPPWENDDPSHAEDIGTIWFDNSGEEMKQYVWDGTEWAESASGIQTYYEPGFRLIDPEDPDSGYILDPDWVPPDPMPVPPVTRPPRWFPIPGVNIGDIWYQIDDNNRPWYFDGTSWLNAADPETDLKQAVETNASAIVALTEAVAEANFLAISANNTADTADGRVSMSDYQPGADDVLYEVLTLDPETGETVSTMVPRQNGSIWFTRTRPRSNLCTNPSLEVNVDGWSGFQADVARVSGIPVPSGFYTLQVTNNAVVGNHTVLFGAANRFVCEEGQKFTASVYAEQISSHTPPEVTIQLRWYNAAGAWFATESGEPYTLVQGAFPAAVAGTIAEPRMWVTGEVPPDAVSFVVAELITSGGEDVVWHTGAMLIEEEDDLGRYFDGDSFPDLPGEAHWESVPHGSVSYLEGDKILQLWELRDSTWIRKYLTSATISSLDVSKLAGDISGAFITDNTIAPDKLLAAQVLASEVLAPGDIVNVWNNAGVFSARKASAAAGYEAHGFVLEAATGGTTVPVYHLGYNPYPEALAPGAQWLSLTPGKVTNQPPASVGSLVQRIGFAPSDSVLNFTLGPAIRIT